MNTRILTTLTFCAILLLTNRWLSYQEGIDILKAADTNSYMTIAQAAPALPSLAPEAFLPTNHTARFVVPYIAGTIAHFSGISNERLFLLATLFFCGVVIWACHAMLEELGCTDSQYALAMALLIFNPYMFRYYLAVPAMVNDVVFVAGLALTLLGLVRGGFGMVLAGGLLAIAGRQNALVFLPALGLWMVLGEKWRTGGVVRSLTRFGIVAAGIVAVYVVIGLIIAPFSVRGMEGDAIMGFVRWVFAPSVGKAKVFAEYFLRTIICLLFPIMILFAAAVVRRLRGVKITDFFTWMPREFWLSMLFVAALYGFAFLGGPELFMSGVTRYVSHALPAMVLAFAFAMKRYNLFSDVEPSLMLALGALCAMGSFHHMTTFGGTTSDKAMYFAVMYCILAIFAGVIAFVALRQKS
ncbi:MAG: hypothetical protein H9535_08970 [Ignavibacteria bacterium]|nr:hypothetical protein [Ignavibacteria bacterium]